MAKHFNVCGGDQVGIYERQKVALETEISNLRAENAKLCREICEKENIILHKVLGTKETKEALELLSRKQQMQVANIPKYQFNYIEVHMNGCDEDCIWKLENHLFL